MSTSDLSTAIEQSHAALGAILRGDPRVCQALYSPADDVTLGNPFGPYVLGRQKVEQTLAGAASHYRDGEVVDVELIATYVSETLACIVEVERGRAKVGGAEVVEPGSGRRNQPISTGERKLEARSPPRRPDYEPASSNIGHQQVALRWPPSRVDRSACGKARRWTGLTRDCSGRRFAPPLNRQVVRQPRPYARH